MSSKKVKIGVFGGGRGQTMVEVMARHPDAELVAICDYSQHKLKHCSDLAERCGTTITCYDDFDKFMEHDMDAVVLANYATEHAPYAVRLLDSGRHVVSEVLAVQTMAEAVQLVEAVERNNKIYAYAENYCYFRGTMEMQRLYRQGDVGEFIHGEGEYVHDCASIWVHITYGEKNHWRNWTPSTFYCTHSMGPLVTITGTRPVRLTAYETPNIHKRTVGCLSGDTSVILCQMNNGATVKILPAAGLKREPGAIWYSVYGSKGMMETDRWGSLYDKLNVYLESEGEMRSYTPEYWLESELSKTIGGHGGSDFYTMHFFLDAILGRNSNDYLIDVYQALDMTLPGTLGYRSILAGNMPIDIPDFRDKCVREQYRNDNWCLDPKMAGPGQPTMSSSFGPVEIDDSLYARQAEEYRKLTGG
ncbi:MAG: Gfo/Idh/MocA family protein [Armatimonadota bacterium]